MHTVNIDFTHVVFTVRYLANSIDFYTRYTAITVIHRREPGLPSTRKVAWLNDHTRPFTLVLVQGDDPADTLLGPSGRLGVACTAQAEIDEKVAQVRREGALRWELKQLDDPVRYFAFFADPDGNTLELSWEQRVGLEAIATGNASQPVPCANIFHHLAGEGLYFKGIPRQHGTQQ